MTRFGLEENHYQQLKQLLNRGLPTDRAAEVWVFGSRARGDHRPFSDIDLLISASPPLSGREMAMLRDMLEESSFPYKVDLAQEHELAESYKPGILRDKVAF